MLTTQPNTFYLQRVYFLIVLWAFAACALSIWRKFFLNLQGFFLFATRFFFWLCCEHLQHVRCQFDESFFLICRCFFLFAVRFFFWLCCEHLQHVRCQNDESCFLNLQGFFYLQRVSFFGCVVSICSMCVVKMTKVVFLICRVFSICNAFLFWLCCEHLQHVRCQNDESCFLNLQGFFYLQRVSFLVVLWAFAACALSKWRKLFS